MAETKIEWTDHSINPIRAIDLETGAVGHFCEKVSPGCAHCYASRLQSRFRMPPFGGARKSAPTLPVVDAEGRIQVSDRLRVFLDRSKLSEVVKRRKPTKFFWCDMTDLFGSWVPDEWIDECFAAMALTPQHTHQVLTKRPERMAEYLNAAFRFGDEIHGAIKNLNVARLTDSEWWSTDHDVPEWPIPNVHLGTSAENQQTLDERVPHLLRCPAAVRFLSCEPLLGPLQLQPYMDGSGVVRLSQGIDCDWVIVGGESGPKARPCDVEWIRSIVRQCRAAGVPVFVKQDSGAKPGMQGKIPDDLWTHKEFPCLTQIQK